MVSMKGCNMKNGIRLLIFILTCALLPCVFADQSPTQSQQIFQYFKEGHLFFHLGGFNATQGKSQDIGIEGLVGDHFTVSEHNDQNVLVGIGYFLDGLQKDNYNLLYGLDAFYLPQTAVTGDIIQEQLFTNLSYRYFISHIPIFLATKTYYKISSNNNLVLDIGIGPNIMSMNKFEEYAIAALPDKAFSSHTEVTFSATAGLGMKFNHIWKNIPLEIAYRFFYLGEGSLTKDNSEFKDTLKTGNNYANALVITLGRYAS